MNTLPITAKISEENALGYTCIVKVKNSPRHTLPYAYLLDTGSRVQGTDTMRYSAFFTTEPLLPDPDLPFLYDFPLTVAWANVYTDEIDWIYDALPFDMAAKINDILQKRITH